MSQYEFASEAINFEDDAWLEVWPVGESRGKKRHLRSWPSLASVIKAEEYCSGLGRLKKASKIIAVQENLQLRYELMQEQIWAVAPTDLPRAVRLTPLPHGTVFSKETVSVDYTVVFGLREVPGALGDDESASRARSLCPDRDTRVTSSSVLGHPTWTAASIECVEDGAHRGATRAVVIAPREHPVCVELVLISHGEEATASIDAVLAGILDRAELVWPAVRP